MPGSSQFTRSFSQIPLVIVDCFAQRLADLLERHHAREPAVGIDRRQGAEPSQLAVAEQRLDRLVVADPLIVGDRPLEQLLRPCSCRG